MHVQGHVQLICQTRMGTDNMSLAICDEAKFLINAKLAHNAITDIFPISTEKNIVQGLEPTHPNLIAKGCSYRIRITFWIKYT